MTYKELRTNTLRLILAYSIAGSQISESYNNQEDYTTAIPALANAAQMEIATTVKKIPEMVLLSDLELSRELPMGKVYNLPSDCYKVNGNALVRINGKRSQYVADRAGFFRQYGNGKIIVPDDLGDDLFLEYYRLPRNIPDNPTDSFELDNTEDTHLCLPYYIGAHLVQYDDAFRYASLYNEWRTKLNELSATTIIEPTYINDAYNGFSGCY